MIQYWEKVREVKHETQGLCGDVPNEYEIQVSTSQSRWDQWVVGAVQIEGVFYELHGF